MRGGRRRQLTVAGAVLLGLAVVGAVGFRMFAPADTVTTAHKPYPQARVVTPGVTGELPRAPLIVDQRLRVYAAKRQVWADTPIAARTETTPFWSLRRWPHEVVGVVETPGPLVVSKWTDGDLIAIDARTGAIAWRAPGPAGAHRYVGGRSGAGVVHTPPDLYTGTTVAGGMVVVSRGGIRLGAWDAGTGAPLWSVDSPCAASGFTGPGFYGEICSGELTRLSLADGTPAQGGEAVRSPAAQRAGSGSGDALVTIAPIGCAVGSSRCTGARSVDGAWMFTGVDGDPVAAPALLPERAWRVGDVAVLPAADGLSLTARALPDGAPQWTWRAPDGSADRSPAELVEAEPDSIYLITRDRTLVVVDPESGRELSRASLARSGAPADWRPGAVYVRDRSVVVERLDPLGHRFGLRPVLIAGS